MKTSESHPLDSLTASGKWVDALLELFWAVDEVILEQGDQGLPREIRAAWVKAEKARKEL